PEFAKAPQTAARAAFFTFASDKTIIGSLPPNSSTTGVSVFAAASATRLPVEMLPVNMILSTPESTNAAPVEPSPVTICNKPSSRPARLKTSPIFNAVKGVNSLGLRTTELPAINEITTSPSGVAHGKFQGEIMPTTPIGL